MHLKITNMEGLTPEHLCMYQMNYCREFVADRHVFIPPGDGSDQTNHVDPEEFFEVKIDIRKFAQFLSGQQVSPSRVICSKLGSFYICNNDHELT